MIRVEVVLALPGHQELVALEVASGTTLVEAVEQSGILGLFPGFEYDPDRLGIFGHRESPERVLCDGERVEIYRPLLADPKEVRRQRALKQK